MHPLNMQFNPREMFTGNGGVRRLHDPVLRDQFLDRIDGLGHRVIRDRSIHHNQDVPPRPALPISDLRNS